MFVMTNELGSKLLGVIDTSVIQALWVEQGMCLFDRWDIRFGCLVIRFLPASMQVTAGFATFVKCFTCLSCWIVPSYTWSNRIDRDDDVISFLFLPSWYRDFRENDHKQRCSSLMRVHTLLDCIIISDECRIEQMVDVDMIFSNHPRLRQTTVWVHRDEHD